MRIRFPFLSMFQCTRVISTTHGSIIIPMVDCRRYYIQSAFAIPDQEKMEQEQNSLVRIDDSFKKIIVVKDRIKLWRNEKGIVIMGIMDFLLNSDSLDW